MSRKEIAIGIIIAAIIAVFLSPLASPSPDGLARVAGQHGFAEKGIGHQIWKAPIPDYVFPGMKNEKLATAIAALLGTSVAFGIVYALALILKRRKDRL